MTTVLLYNTQSNFTGGVLSASANSRSDTDLYQKSLQQGDNTIIIPQGGISRRAASEFTHEFDSLTDIFTNADSVLHPVTEGTNNFIFFFNVSQYGIYDISADTLTAGIAYPSATTFTVDEIQRASFVTTPTELLLFSIKQPISINITTPFASSFFTIKNPPTNDFDDINYSAINFTPSATSGAAVTLTASSAVFTAAYVGGRFFGNGGNLRITTFSSTTVVIGNTTSDFIDTSTFSGGVSYLGEPIFSSARGYAQVASYGFSRLWAGRTTSIPNGIWWSVNNTVNDFDASDPNAGSGGGGTLGARGSNNLPYIRKIFITRALFLLTTEGIWASDRLTGDGVSDSDVNLEFQGIDVIKDKTNPVYIEDKLHFISNSGKAIISSRYDINSDTYKFDNSTLTSEDVIDNPTHLIAYPFDDNKAGSFIMSIEGDSEYAWNMSISAIEESAWTPADCTGSILNGVIVDNDFYIYTQRSNTATDFWLEKVSFNKLVDAQSDFTNTSSLTVTYLADLSVVIIKDGDVVFETVPSNGVVPLGDTFSNVTIGLNFIPIIKPLSPSVNLQNGNTLLRRKSINNIKLDLLNTAGITIEGQELSNFIIDSSLLGSVLSTVTDVIEVPIINNYGFKTDFTIKQIYPATMTIKAIEIKYEVLE